MGMARLGANLNMVYFRRRIINYVAFSFRDEHEALSEAEDLRVPHRRWSSRSCGQRGTQSPSPRRLCRGSHWSDFIRSLGDSVSYPSLSTGMSGAIPYVRPWIRSSNHPRGWGGLRSTHFNPTVSNCHLGA